MDLIAQYSSNRNSTDKFSENKYNHLEVITSNPYSMELITLK